MLKQKAIPVLLVISLLSNVFLAFRIIDMGVANTHGNDEISRRNGQVRVAERFFLPLIAGFSKSELIDAAKKAGVGVMDKGEDGIYVGEIRLTFSNDRLVSVSFD